jgi:hypothetical protein
MHRHSSCAANRVRLVAVYAHCLQNNHTPGHVQYLRNAAPLYTFYRAGATQEKTSVKHTKCK